MRERDPAPGLPAGTLHIVNKRPGHERFRACLVAVGSGDVLVLMENAVTAVADASVGLPAGTCVLRADCEARGLSGPLLEDVEQLGYEDLVGLTDRFVRIVNW